jgi:DNA repair exonuclease SbcCD nuclease subunit
MVVQIKVQMKTLNFNEIALIGDPHIGVNKNSEEFFEIMGDWFDYFLKDIESRGIHHVFILGDWFHYRDEIDVSALDFATRILEMFPRSVNIYMLTGNHDCYFKDNSEIHSLRSYNNWENITIYDTNTTVQCGEKVINIVPWGGDITSLPKSDYIFGHFEITNFKWNAHSICTDGVDSSDLIKHGSAVYTGHFHQKQTKDYKTGQINYVGSPTQHNFNDVGNKNGYHILNIKSGDCEFVENDGFPLFKYIKLSKMKEVIPADLKNNFIKLFIDIPKVTEKQLEKILAKLWSFDPRNIVVEDKNVKNLVANGNISDTIGEIDMLKCITEFVDLIDTNLKEDINTKMKYYYEKQQENEKN